MMTVLELNSWNEMYKMYNLATGGLKVNMKNVHATLINHHDLLRFNLDQNISATAASFCF